jgi:hypothetical protein
MPFTAEISVVAAVLAAVTNAAATIFTCCAADARLPRYVRPRPLRPDVAVRQLTTDAS